MAWSWNEPKGPTRIDHPLIKELDMETLRPVALKLPASPVFELLGTGPPLNSKASKEAIRESRERFEAMVRGDQLAVDPFALQEAGELEECAELRKEAGRVAKTRRREEMHASVMDNLKRRESSQPRVKRGETATAAEVYLDLHEQFEAKVEAALKPGYTRLKPNFGLESRALLEFGTLPSTSSAALAFSTRSLSQTAEKSKRETAHRAVQDVKARCQYKVELERAKRAELLEKELREKREREYGSRHKKSAKQLWSKSRLSLRLHRAAAAARTQDVQNKNQFFDEYHRILKGSDLVGNVAHYGLLRLQGQSEKNKTTLNKREEHNSANPMEPDDSSDDSSDDDDASSPRQGKAAAGRRHGTNNNNNLEVVDETASTAKHAREAYIVGCVRRGMSPEPLIKGDALIPPQRRASHGNAAKAYDAPNSKPAADGTVATKDVDLNLAHFGVGPDRVAALAEALPAMASRLRVLDLSDNRLDAASTELALGALKAAVSMIASRNGLRLVEMNLSQNRTCLSTQDAAASLGAVISVSPLLEALTLNATGLGVVGLEETVAGLCDGKRRVVKVLDVSDNKIAGASPSLAVLLTAPECRLRRLDLSWNALGGAAGELASSIGGANYVRGQPASASFLGDVVGPALAENSTLQELVLSHAGLRDADVEALAVGLGSNIALKQLDLAWNRFTARTALILAYTLSSAEIASAFPRVKGPTGLKFLDLSGNPVGRPGARALLRRRLRGFDTVVSLRSCTLGRGSNPSESSTSKASFKKKKLKSQASGFDVDKVARDSPFVLDMAKPYDRAVASEIARAAYLDRARLLVQKPQAEAMLLKPVDGQWRLTLDDDDAVKNMVASPSGGSSVPPSSGEGMSVPAGTPARRASVDRSTRRPSFNGGGERGRARRRSSSTKNTRGYVFPASGKLEVSYQVSKHGVLVKRRPCLEPEVLDNLVAALNDEPSRTERSALLDMLSRDVYLHTDQLQVVVDRVATVTTDTHVRETTPARDLISAFWPRIVDEEKKLDLLVKNCESTLPKQLEAMRAECHEKFVLCEGNPTAHWKLDLGRDPHRAVLASLLDVADAERSACGANSGRDDTSQAGDGSNFRNGSVNRRHVNLTEQKLRDILDRGDRSSVVEFDFVSYARPSQKTDAPMTFNAMSKIRADLAAYVRRCHPPESGSLCTASGHPDGPRGSDDDSSDDDDDDENAKKEPFVWKNLLTLLRLSTIGTFMTARHLLAIHDYMTGLFPEPPRPNAVVSPPAAAAAASSSSSSSSSSPRPTGTASSSQANDDGSASRDADGDDQTPEDDQTSSDRSRRPAADEAPTMDDQRSADVLVTLFTRLWDLENLPLVMAQLSRAGVSLVAKRLGWLNICNPFNLPPRISLDLRHRDNRLLAHHLLLLATKEASSEKASVYEEEPDSDVTIASLYERLGSMVRTPMPAVLRMQQTGDITPNWRARLGLFSSFLLATKPVPDRVFDLDAELYKLATGKAPPGKTERRKSRRPSERKPDTGGPGPRPASGTRRFASAGLPRRESSGSKDNQRRDSSGSKDNQRRDSSGSKDNQRRDSSGSRDSRASRRRSSSKEYTAATKPKPAPVPDDQDSVLTGQQSQDDDSILAPNLRAELDNTVGLA